MRTDHLTDMLGAVGQHDQQFGARLNLNSLGRVQSQSAQFLAERAVTRFAGDQYVLPSCLPEPGGKMGDLRGLAGPLHAFKSNEH